MPIVIGDGTRLPVHRPGVEFEAGRLWIPSTFVPDDVFGDGVQSATGVPSALNLGATLNTCPYTKYMFVRPGSSLDVTEFINFRDNNRFLGDATINSVAGYVFALGDSSSCGGTEIIHDPNDTMQAFVRSADARQGFSGQGMTRGGFFLIGDRQGVGAQATQIKKIIFDTNIDFIVLALHRTGTQLDLTLNAFRHLIASIRWDLGPKLPILIMVGDENINHDLMTESERDILFVGDLTDQDTREKQINMSDRYGFLGVNFWPLMAFLPNADNGPSIETTLFNMTGPRLFHPLLIPASGSGCPFNTTRALTDNELSQARASFVQTSLTGPVVNPKVRTTSMWFWDLDTTKFNSLVQNWSVLRHNLDGDSSNLDYVSDMTTAWESEPIWVGHPIYDRPFAIELLMQPRSSNPNFVAWDREVKGAGNIPALHGAKDQREGWITVVQPFELSPTASEFYLRDVFATDPRGVPVIPPYVNFSWLRAVTQEAIDNANTGSGGGFFDIIGGLISSIIDLVGDALEYVPDRLGLLADSNDADFLKWSAGLNQPRVVLSGTAEFGAPEDGTHELDLKVAPFAVSIQTINFEFNGDLGFVWPARVFNIIPIHMPRALEQFSLDLTSTFLDDWDDLGFEFAAGSGTTPVRYSLDPNEDIRDLVEQATNLRIPAWSVLEPLLDHKADFPPMIDADDQALVSLAGTSARFTGRNFSNHLARIDITHPRVIRVRELNFGGRGGGGGVFTEGVLQNWPISEDREIKITRGFNYEDAIYACNFHGALDLVYSDGTESRTTQILATGPGIVSRVSHSNASGPYIEITHSIPPLPSVNTFITSYLHLSNQFVQEGDIVTAGEVIGSMGGNQPGEGISTGLHLHFGIQKGGPCEKLNPCDELPLPLNGIDPADCGSGIPFLIRTAFTNAITAAGEDLLITDECGNTILKADLAVAIAFAESGHIASSQNCIAGPLAHLGLFQIQNPTHIDNDIASGNIRAVSVITNHPPCPGIRVSLDYFVPSRNIAAALRISQNGKYWGAWQTFTEKTYLEYLGLTCFGA